MKKKFGVILGVALVAVMLVAVLAACVPSDPAKAKANLEAEKYIVVQLDTPEKIVEKLEDIDATTVTSVVWGTKGSLTEGLNTIFVIYFKDTASAKDYYAKIKETYDKMSEKEREVYEIGRSGSVVYSGTVDAVKAVK